MILVVAIVTDLIFSTKIRSTAESLRVPLIMVKDLQSLKLKLSERPQLVMIDMNAHDADPIACIREIVTSSTPRPHIVAFLSHVQASLAAAARDAGADVVLPRSTFSEKLPELLLGAA